MPTQLPREDIIRAQVVILILVGTLLAGATAAGGLQLWQSHQDAHTTVRQRPQSGAQVVSANVEWVVETARQMLKRVDDSLTSGPDCTRTQRRNWPQPYRASLAIQRCT